MLQEDSNGETGFEFIEKKIDEVSVSESLSSMSSIPSIPSSSGPTMSTPAGNLLSNVPPPSELPSFISNMVASAPISQPTFSAQTPLNDAEDDTKEHFYPTQFSPAIPPSKGIPHGEMPGPSVSPQATGSTMPPIVQWVKDAALGSILSKVAEKAKNSVDSMITTLDPQMREFIYSGGDVDILVASDKEMKISPVREAFQSVFGKATVSGISVQPTSIAVQPVGFAAGIKAADERIAAVYTAPQSNPMPVVAVENFLLEVGEDRWYEMGVLILSDPSKKIYLQTFTQTTPVPSAVVSVLQEDTPDDYPLKWSGFSASVGGVMAKNLSVDHSQWQQALTGVSRRESVLLAARTLAGLYKTSLKQA